MEEITLHFKCGHKFPRSAFRKVIGRLPLRCPECGAAGTKRTLKCKCGKTYSISFNGAKYSRLCESCRIEHAANVKRAYQRKQRKIESAIKKKLNARLAKLAKAKAEKELKDAMIEAALQGALQPDRYPDCKHYEECLQKAAFANEALNCEKCRRYKKLSIFNN